MTRAFDEIIDFFAAGTTPKRVASFQPSESTKARVADLIHREKLDGLSPEESAELTEYLRLEHFMRLVKARAHQYLVHE